MNLWLAKYAEDGWSCALHQAELAPAPESARQREALLFFKRLLGARWDGWRRGYPLSYRFWFRRGSFPSDGVLLARCVERAAKLDRGQAFTRGRRLGSAERHEFEAAELELETFDVLSELGAHPRFVPERRGGSRSADLVATLEEREVSLELKRLQPAEKEAGAYWWSSRGSATRATAATWSTPATTIISGRWAIGSDGDTAGSWF